MIRHDAVYELSFRLARCLNFALRAYAGGDVHDPDAWAVVARHFRADVRGARFDPICGTGAYAPVDPHIPTTDDRGVIYVNTVFSRRTQARTIAHETAHHLLTPSDPNFGRTSAFGSWHSNYHLRERIARRAVAMIFLAQY